MHLYVSIKVERPKSKARMFARIYREDYIYIYSLIQVCVNDISTHALPIEAIDPPPE